jgi:hypothetical protein
VRPSAAIALSAATLGLAAAGVAAQPSDVAPPRSSVEVTAGIGSAFIDAATRRVRPRFVATAAVRSVRPLLGSSISLGGLLRGAVVPVRIEESGSDRNGGMATEVAGEVIVERSLHDLIDLFAGGGVLSLFAPAELAAALESGGRSSFHPVLELGAGIRDVPYVPVGLALSVQGYYLSDTPASQTTTNGRWVGRLSAGARYSW